MLIGLFIYIMLFYILNLVQLNSFSLTCFGYNSIIGILTKQYHAYKCCGSSINTGWSNNTQRYNYVGVFLPKYHPFRRVESNFNSGKPKNLKNWNIVIKKLRVYNRKKGKDIVKLFDSNRVPMLIYPKFFDNHANKMSIEMTMNYFILWDSILGTY